MTAKSFLTLLVVTVLVTAAAVWVTVSRDVGSGARGEGELMFAGLQEQVGDIRKITVTRNDVTLHMTAEGQGENVSWHLQEKDGYPVPIESIRAVVAGMAQIRAVEAKTNRPAKYHLINVRDPKTEGAESSLVELFGADGNRMAALIIGLDHTSFTGPGDLYVRRPDEARSWLAHGQVPIPDKTIGWLNQEIVGVDLPRIRETTLFVPGEPPLRIFKSKPRQQDFEIAGLPENREIKDVFTVEDISRAIQNLYLEDVRAAEEIGGFDLSSQPRGRHVTFDGLIVELWAREADGKLWVTARARANPDPAEIDKVDEEQVKKDVAEINRTNEGWAYSLSDFETKNLKKTLADITAPKPGSDATN